MNEPPSHAAQALREAHVRRAASFARAMVRKLDRNVHKGDWRASRAPNLLATLLRRLKEETAELELALLEGARAPGLIVEEAADVANFALMIADLVAPQDRP